MKKATRYKFEPSWREATYSCGKYYTNIEAHVREYIETGETDEEYLQFSFFYPAWKVIKAEIDKRKARNARARELRRRRRERQLTVRDEKEKQAAATAAAETATSKETEASHQAGDVGKAQSDTPQTVAVKADSTTANPISESISAPAQKIPAPDAHSPSSEGTRHDKTTSPSMPRWLRESGLQRAQKKKHRRL